MKYCPSDLKCELPRPVCSGIGFGRRTAYQVPMRQKFPNFSHEQAAFMRGFTSVCGVDEVGRGPLAGPVTAAAVRLVPDGVPASINDSKRLTASQRAILSAEIHACAEVSIAHATVKEIDEMNILGAAHLAMVRAIAQLSPSPDFALIDGNLIPRGLAIPAEALVKGDGRSLSIAAASIVAKHCRDTIMANLACEHPEYCWETNAGYGTRAHLDALAGLGPTPHHRRSFKPVRDSCRQIDSHSDQTE